MKANILLIHLNSLCTQVDLTPAPTTQMQSTGLKVELPNMANKCQAQLKQVQKTLYKQAQDSVKLRLDKMEPQAKLEAVVGKSTKAFKLRKMLNAEKIAEMFCQIKAIRGIASNTEFTSIKAPVD
jgi:hypothetical protein